MTEEELIQLASEARRLAYAPYSGFAVGAAILGRDGKVYTGANVENSSYGLSMCAERAALYNAIGAGCLTFTMLAVVADSSPPATPCGACRQVLFEFAPELSIVCANEKSEFSRFELRDLLPHGFTHRKRA